MNRGFTITTAGARILTSLLAGERLVITKLMVGKGVLAEGQEPADLTELIDPVALATSTEPVMENQQVNFIVEYRNDLNGGLDQGVYLDEFGVWGKKERDTGEGKMIYYSTLGDYPQWIGPLSNGMEVLRYPVAIGLAVNTEVTLNYPAGAFVTAEEFNAAMSKKANVRSNFLPPAEVSDFNAFPSGKLHAMGNFLHEPEAGFNGEVETTRYDLAGTQEALNYNTGHSFRRILTSGSWSSWTPLATATPPQELGLPLAEGIGNYGRCRYWKTQFGAIQMDINVISAANQDDLSGKTLATLPSGFRPSSVRASVVFARNVGGSVAAATAVVVYPDGHITADAYRATIGVVHAQISFQL